MSSKVRHKQEGMFFLQPATINALKSLMDAEQIVIYCGAGVTIDQTGVKWDELVRQVFGVGMGANPEPSTTMKSIEFLLSVMDDPRQMASIVTEAFRNELVNENDSLKTALHQILYTKRTWSTGQILRNVARFAIMASLFGRNVTIITTNYDAYIESEIDFRFRAMVDELGVPNDRSPGLFRHRDSLDAGSDRVDIMKAQGGAGEIELVYLHGRIDKNGTSEGVIVLTESSYALTREASTAVLQKHFRMDELNDTSKAVLIVGASLTDVPLIDALANTHNRQGSQSGSPQIRLALSDLPIPRATFDEQFESKVEAKIDSGHVRDGLALRAKHLGIEVLWPSSHSQTAQFLEEMRVDLSARKRHDRADAYQAPDLGLSYAARLKLWETQFQSSRTMLDQSFVHNHLSLMNDAIKLELEALNHTHKFDPEHETLRLELWARVRPSSRLLELIGNSTGPLIDRNALRKESVSNTSNASTLAFLEGRPLIRSIESLDPRQAANRWQTFLAVPIIVHVETEDAVGGGRIPVGVITLASTLSRTHRIKGHWSVFRELGGAALDKLKTNRLIPGGKGLLSPHRAEVHWREFDEKRQGVVG